MAEKLYVRKGVTSESFYLENEEMHVLKGGSTYLVSLREKSWLYVSKGGVAERTAVSSGGKLIVSKGGVAERTTVSSGGYCSIDKGGMAKDVTALSGGWCYVFSGGSASGVEIAKGGNLYLDSGGTATGISWTPCQGRFAFSGGVYSFASRISGVHYGSDNTRISSWASQVSSKVVLAGGSMCIMHGGTADKMTVASNGSMYVFSGGTATSATFNGGYAYLNGGVMKNTTLNGGIMFIQRGGIVSGLSVTNGGIVYVESGGTLTNCSGNFSLHVYKGGTATVLKTSYGTLTVAKGAKVYNVSCSADSVDLLNGASIKWNSNLALLPEPSRDCDDGWNNWLYDSKTKERNRFLPFSSAGVTLQSGYAGEIRLDDSNPSGATYWNYVGYRDEVDFQKITLKSAARLSFKVSAYGSVKFTLWKLTKNTTKKGGYKLKSLQTRTFKSNSIGGVMDYTPSILLPKSDSGTEYFISVESKDATKTGGENYRVELCYYADSQDRRGTCFFADGDEGWNILLLDSGKNPNPELIPTLVNKSNQTIELDSGLSKTIAGVTYNGFVGFGDEIDYGKLKVGADAKLTFEVTAKDAAKFTVYELLASGKKKSVLSGKCKKDHNDIEGDPVYVFTNSKGVKLKKDRNYYLCVQSTNAKKSAVGTYYSVKVLTYESPDVGAVLNEADFGMNAGLNMPDASSGDSLSGLQDGLSFGSYLTDGIAVGAASAADALFDDGSSGWLNIAKLA